MAKIKSRVPYINLTSTWQKWKGYSEQDLKRWVFSIVLKAFTVLALRIWRGRRNQIIMNIYVRERELKIYIFRLWFIYPIFQYAHYIKKV